MLHPWIVSDFNPHHPRGWRPYGAHRQSKPVYYFNPHHPRGWRLFDGGQNFGQTENISIHTTLAGGDRRKLFTAHALYYFNPHHPRGWRQGRQARRMGRTPFQSTPPSRVATTFKRIYKAINLFQSTPPSRVATQNIQAINQLKVFQSTPPSRVATAKMDEKFIHFLFLLKHNIQ